MKILMFIIIMTVNLIVLSQDINLTKKEQVELILSNQIKDSIIIAQQILIDNLDSLRVSDSIKLVNSSNVINDLDNILEVQKSKQIELNNLCNINLDIQKEKLNNKRFGFGVSLGYGVTYAGKLDGDYYFKQVPYIGLSLNYNFFKF